MRGIWWKSMHTEEFFGGDVSGLVKGKLFPIFELKYFHQAGAS